jgi:fructokinase
MAENALSRSQSATSSAGTAILLFGELLVDCFPDREVAGGAPFNVARHLLGLGRVAGLEPVLVTRIGKDERGRHLLEAMQAAGLNMDGVQQDLLYPTGAVRVTQVRGADEAGHSFEIPPDQAWDFIHPDIARLVGLMHRPRWLYYGTLAQRAASRLALRALQQTTHARGFLDLNLRDPWVREDVLRWSLAKAEIVKANDVELSRVANMLGLVGASPRALGERLIKTFGIGRLLVTEGEKGAWLLDASGGYHALPAPAPITGFVDSVGAGDGFAAAFLLGLSQGWPVEQTLARAHRFAGEICRLRGAIPDSDDFYRPFVSEWRLAGEATT